MCDQTTGRCVCPPNSHGPDCQHCVAKTWGWAPKVGCKKCECDAKGSIGACDPLTGQCQCREGFVGKSCSRCASDYYGYPNCTRCSCDPRGSLASECDHLGQCACRELVTGLKCDQCRQATFGLAAGNRLGCTRCYCFGRSQVCDQSDLSWGQIRQFGARNLTVEYITPLRAPSADFEYVVVVQMQSGHQQAAVSGNGNDNNAEDAKIERMNHLHLIPGTSGNISIGSYARFGYPLYFQLPPAFLGDKITSYGGRLRFTLTSEGCENRLGSDVLQRFPLIQIHAHDDLVVDYFGVSYR